MSNVKVKDLQSEFRERIILGLDAAKFTEDLSLIERLDAVRIDTSKELAGLIGDLIKNGTEEVPVFCVGDHMNVVEESIKRQYREVGLKV